MGSSRSLLVVAALVSAGLTTVVGHAADAVVRVPAPKVRLTVGDLSVKEGDAGSIPVEIPITLDMPAKRPVIVHWAVTGATATAGVDFTAPATGIATIRRGQTEALVPITIIGDMAPEGDETVSIDAVSVLRATVTKSHGTLTIQDDDTAPAAAAAALHRARPFDTTPSVFVGSPTVTEGNTGTRYAIIPIAMSVPPPTPVTLKLVLPGLPITPECSDVGQEPVGPINSTVSFVAGQQSMNWWVSVAGNVSVDATVRSFADHLSVQSGAVTVEAPNASVDVVDDDTAPGAGSIPAVGTHRVSETATGGNPTFPPAIGNPAYGCGWPSSEDPAVSPDGRYVAFFSNADNLVGGDTNGWGDVFIKDTWNGAIERVSVASDGTQGDWNSYDPSISADDRFVGFTSNASTLANEGRGYRNRAYIYDRSSDTLTKLPVPDGYTQTWRPQITPDDRYVQYSAGRQGPDCDPAWCTETFLFDRTTGNDTLISTDANGPFPFGSNANFSANGRYLVFAGVEGTSIGVWRYDVVTGSLTPVTEWVPEEPWWQSGDADRMHPVVSDDGQVVAFLGDCLMGASATACHADVYGHRLRVTLAYNATTQTTSLVSTTYSGDAATPQWTPFGPSISADGRYVTYTSPEDDLAAAAGCNITGLWGSYEHVYLRDLVTGGITKIDQPSKNYPCAADAWTMSGRAISADGNYVVYTGAVTPTINGANPYAVFIRRLR